VQGDDARQVGHVGSERADVVIAPGHAQGDRQLGVEVLDLDLARLEQVEQQAPPEAGIG
jgi:hypothetical protein